MILPPHRIDRETKSLWPACAGRDAEGLISSQSLPRAMDTQDILDAALRLAKQSEIPSDTPINVPATNVPRPLFGIDVEPADFCLSQEKRPASRIHQHPPGRPAPLRFR